MGSIIKIGLYAFLIIGLAYLIPGITVAGFWPTAIIVGLAFALVNALVRALFSGNIIFGIIAIILNTIGLWLIAQYVSGFDIQGFIFQGYAIGSYITALVGALLGSLGVYLINEIF
jgi:uncharacterized membrane protein YvlD (DUF360 family)